ncbi:MAG: hypothetical protein ACRDH2_12750, partial [Anaerolineales bacterium]
LAPLPNGGTRLTVSMTGEMPTPRFLNRAAFRIMHTKVYPMAKMYEKMAQVMAESIPSEPVSDLATAAALS